MALQLDGGRQSLDSICGVDGVLLRLHDVICVLLEEVLLLSRRTWRFGLRVSRGDFEVFLPSADFKEALAGKATSPRVGGGVCLFHAGVATSHLLENFCCSE